MGYQTSRIIWGKTKQNPDDDGYNEVPVSDYENDIIYTSGNLVIYENKTLGTVGVYQCMVEEVCNNSPDLYTEEWKKVEGVPLFKTAHIPGAPSDVIEYMSTVRSSYTPGARVIVKNINGTHTLYKCKEKTNVYLEGFLYSKWEKVYHRPGIVYIPKDHKEVYYDDGHNQFKWHHAMYYLNNEDFDNYEEEICGFNPSTSYAKGEMVLYDQDNRDPNLYHSVYRYIYHIPSTPTTRNEQKGTITYEQPTPSNHQYWEYVESIQYFNSEKSYTKGDKVIWNRYNEEDDETTDGRGWSMVPVSIFRDDYVYRIGQRCLYRIKPTEEGNISQSDLDKLIETSDYTMEPWDEQFPEDLIPVPASEYGKRIEANAEIYGLYEYKGIWGIDGHGEKYLIQDYKPRGYAFSNDEWNLIPDIRMLSGKDYGANKYVIAPYNETYVLFKTKQAIAPGEYITREDYELYGLDAIRYGYFITEDVVVTPSGLVYIGIPASPQDLDTHRRVSDVWTVIKQRQIDPTIGPRIYIAVRDKRYGFEFSRADWTICTQNKIGRNTLYGWIWKKFTSGSGGTPYGAVIPIPSVLEIDYSPVRFNVLSIYRGDNVLETGPVSNGLRNYDSAYNWKLKIIGQTAWYYNTDTFYIKNHYGNTWNKFSLYNIIEKICPYYSSLSRIEYRKDGVITVHTISEDGQSRELWKIVLTDYVNKLYGASKKTVTYLTSMPTINWSQDDNYVFPEYISGLDSNSDGYFYMPISDLYDNYYIKTSVDEYAILATSKCLQVGYYFNENNEVIKTYLKDHEVDGDVADETSYKNRVKVSHMLTSIDSYMDYMLSDLADFTAAKEPDTVFYAGVTYYVFTDGWEGDTDSENTKEWGDMQARRLMHALYNCLDTAGLVQTFKYEKLDYPIWDSKYARYIEGYGIYRMEFMPSKQGYYALYPRFNEVYKDKYNFPIHFDHGELVYDWVHTEPVFKSFSFYSQDGTVLYSLNCLYGMYATKLDSTTDPDTDVFWYALAFLDITRMGVTTSYELIREKVYGACEIDPVSGLYIWHDWNSDKFICHLDVSGSMIFSPVFYDDNNLYLINPLYKVTTDSTLGFESDTVTFSRSTGLWVVSFNTWKVETDQSLISDYEYKTKSSVTLYEFSHFENKIQALFRLCWIEKIPYYGYKTCHINSINRDIKYLCINFGDFPIYEESSYVHEKMEAWRKDKCLIVDIHIWEYINSPIVNASTNTIVTNSDDIIITKFIGIPSEEGSHDPVRFQLCVVLPHFKTIFPNCIENLQSGLSAYDPIIAGAFFWITSDDPYAMADPQYGGPEYGAKGFSGW